MFATGVVSTETLVLQEGMYDWIHFVDLKKTTQNLPVIGGGPKVPEVPEKTDTTGTVDEADKAEP